MISSIIKLYRRIKLDRQLGAELFRYFRIIRKNNGSSDTFSDPNKMQSLIARESHVLEKGMSMPEPHFPFGVERASELISHLERLLSSTAYDNTIIYNSINIIEQYIKFHQKNGYDLTEIKNRLERLLLKFPSIKISNNLDGGIRSVSNNEITSEARLDFSHLLSSRHSHRNFTSQHVPDDIITKALALASLTPSACNRQAWRTHVFDGEKARQLLKWQEGCRGFYDKINRAILVTSDLNSFFAHEAFQAYIDGGLYSMNLINALHYYGLGTIPLSCGFPYKKLFELSKFDIPRNEIPIIIIGIGFIPEETHVASSQRLEITKTNTFHG